MDGSLVIYWSARSWGDISPYSMSTGWWGRYEPQIQSMLFDSWNWLPRGIGIPLWRGVHTKSTLGASTEHLWKVPRMLYENPENRKGDFPFATCLRENSGIDFYNRGSSAPWLKGGQPASHKLFWSCLSSSGSTGPTLVSKAFLLGKSVVITRVLRRGANYPHTTCT